MTTQMSPANPFVLHLVDIPQRRHFLHHHFDRLAPSFERALISVAKRCITGPTDLYWQFANGPLNTPIIFPRDAEFLGVSSLFNSQPRSLPAILAGIYVSSLAIIFLLDLETELALTEEEHDQLCTLHRTLINLGHDLATYHNCSHDWFVLVD